MGSSSPPLSRVRFLPNDLSAITRGLREVGISLWFIELRNTVFRVTYLKDHNIYLLTAYFKLYIDTQGPQTLSCLLGIVRRNIGHMAYRVEMEYRPFLSIDSSL